MHRLSKLAFDRKIGNVSQRSLIIRQRLSMKMNSYSQAHWLHQTIFQQSSKALLKQYQETVRDRNQYKSIGRKMMSDKHWQRNGIWNKKAWIISNIHLRVLSGYQDMIAVVQTCSSIPDPNTVLISLTFWSGSWCVLDNNIPIPLGHTNIVL